MNGENPVLALHVTKAIDLPSRPDGATAPNRSRVVEIMTILGLLVGIVVGFLRDSFIVGVTDPEQLESQLGAADVQLDTAVLDRIDEIVPPGTNVNQADTGWDPPWLVDSSLRRR